MSNQNRHPGSGKFKSHSDPRDYYVVCERRKQLSIPILWNEATSFVAGLRTDDINVENVQIVPYIEVRSWCGV